MAQIMEFLLNLLLLRKKIFTTTAAETFYEAIRKCLQFKRKISAEYKAATQMIGPFENMLEFINYNASQYRCEGENYIVTSEVHFQMTDNTKYEDYNSNRKLENSTAPTQSINFVRSQTVEKKVGDSSEEDSASIPKWLRREQQKIEKRKILNQEHIVDNLCAILRSQEFLFKNLIKLVNMLEKVQVVNARNDQKLEKIKEKLVSCTDILSNNQQSQKFSIINNLIEEEITRCRFRSGESKTSDEINIKKTTPPKGIEVALEPPHKKEHLAIRSKAKPKQEEKVAQKTKSKTPKENKRKTTTSKSDNNIPKKKLKRSNSEPIIPINESSNLRKKRTSETILSEIRTDIENSEKFLQVNKQHFEHFEDKLWHSLTTMKFVSLKEEHLNSCRCMFYNKRHFVTTEATIVKKMAHEKETEHLRQLLNTRNAVFQMLERKLLFEEVKKELESSGQLPYTDEVTKSVTIKLETQTSTNEEDNPFKKLKEDTSDEQSKRQDHQVIVVGNDTNKEEDKNEIKKHDSKENFMVNVCANTSLNDLKNKTPTNLVEKDNKVKTERLRAIEKKKRAYEEKFVSAGTSTNNLQNKTSETHVEEDNKEKQAYKEQFMVNIPARTSTNDLQNKTSETHVEEDNKVITEKKAEREKQAYKEKLMVNISAGTSTNDLQNKISEHHIEEDNKVVEEKKVEKLAAIERKKEVYKEKFMVNISAGTSTNDLQNKTSEPHVEEDNKVAKEKKAGRLTAIERKKEAYKEKFMVNISAGTSTNDLQNKTSKTQVKEDNKVVTEKKAERLTAIERKKQAYKEKFMSNISAGTSTNDLQNNISESQSNKVITEKKQKLDQETNTVINSFNIMKHVPADNSTELEKVKSELLSKDQDKSTNTLLEEKEWARSLVCKRKENLTSNEDVGDGTGNTTQFDKINTQKIVIPTLRLADPIKNKVKSTTSESSPAQKKTQSAGKVNVLKPSIKKTLSPRNKNISSRSKSEDLKKSVSEAEQKKDSPKQHDNSRLAQIVKQHFKKVVKQPELGVTPKINSNLPLNQISVPLNRNQNQNEVENNQKRKKIPAIIPVTSSKKTIEKKLQDANSKLQVISNKACKIQTVPVTSDQNVESSSTVNTKNETEVMQANQKAFAELEATIKNIQIVVKKTQPRTQPKRCCPKSNNKATITDKNRKIDDSTKKNMSTKHFPQTTTDDSRVRCPLSNKKSKTFLKNVKKCSSNETKKSKHTQSPPVVVEEKNKSQMRRTTKNAMKRQQVLTIYPKIIKAKEKKKSKISLVETHETRAVKMKQKNVSSASVAVRDPKSEAIVKNTTKPVSTKNVLHKSIHKMSTVSREKIRWL